jgi:anti-sigma factor RsiW
MRQEDVCTISISDEISAYMDCMLDGRSMRRIARHIKSCEDCRSSLSRLMEIRASMRQVRKSPGSASEEFWANTFRTARLSDEDAALKPEFTIVASPPRTTFSIRRVAAYSVAAAIILAAIAAPFSLGGHQPAGQPVEAAESVDIDAIVDSHAHAIIHEPLVNRSRSVMIESESTTRQTGNSVDEAVFDIDQNSTDLPPAIR